MSLTREALSERLLRHYEVYFDIARTQGDSPLQAICRFHSRSEKYVLVKKAQLWAAENNEYLYLFSVPELDMSCFEQCRDMALELGMEEIHPHSEHMYSYITAVILCDRAQPEALDALKRYRKSHSFKLSLHGWMEYHIAAVELTTAEVTANRAGAKLKKSLAKLVDSETKRNSDFS